MVDSLLEDYEKSGMVDEKYEILLKNAAAQIYGGTSPYFNTPCEQVSYNSFSYSRSGNGRLSVSPRSIKLMSLPVC